jgi:hypothetical protein
MQKRPNRELINVWDNGTELYLPAKVWSPNKEQGIHPDSYKDMCKVVCILKHLSFPEDLMSAEFKVTFFRNHALLKNTSGTGTATLNIGAGTGHHSWASLARAMMI